MKTFLTNIIDLNRHHKKCTYIPPTCLPEPSKAQAIPVFTDKAVGSPCASLLNGAVAEPEDTNACHFDNEVECSEVEFNDTSVPYTLESDSPITFDTECNTETANCTYLSLKLMHPRRMHQRLRTLGEDPLDFIALTITEPNIIGDDIGEALKVAPANRRMASLYEAEHRCKGSGLQQLAVTLFSPFVGVGIHEISLTWTLFALLFSTLLLETQASHHSAVCVLLNVLVHKLSPSTGIPVHIPRNTKQAKRIYTDQQNRQRAHSSLIHEINLARAEELGDGHTYCSLLATVRFLHSTGHCLEPKTPRGFQILSRTLKMLGARTVPDDLNKQNVTEVSLPFHLKQTAHDIGVYFITLWSDSFEPMATKTNRGSVWALFVSIATPGPFLSQ